ncbi:PepSY-associated TM helix domain-containing protein [Arenibacter sp. F20364]|uniref:PepSY-associated TM helix domain-containing protein n=1 Tax=Arenibacter sp. F20364 TaxID=2926415 RepID=UPI001FF326E3|nr:PepSY-associated TM helix domain-containing protein [Arenibacter sp. F20364]MCK0188404.1 PepSY domain-containing protein [Arenibacter sp. F20364]
MSNKSKKYTLRKFINDAHLWLGIGSGIILFLVCLSGTVLTFEEEIKDLFAKEFVIMNTSGSPLSIEKLSESISKEGVVSNVTIPAATNEALKFQVKTSPKDRRGTTYFVDPYSGEYQKEQKSNLDGFFMTMFKMHRWLLLETEVGRPIVGVATIIFLFLAISGMVLWFPKRMKWKSFKPGFKIKYKANWKRINHDLHNTLGFYACIFLVIMSLTGLFWSFEWYRDAGSTVLGTKVFGNRGGGPNFKSALNPGAKEITFEEILQLTSRELDFEGKTTISIPVSENDVYTVTKNNNSRFSPITTDKLIFDRDGTLLHKELFANKPLNVQIASLIKPIHIGTIYGTFSKIIYFFACLIATSLPITGTLIWINKLKTKKSKKKQPVLV